ncbi:hypothetical protein N7449_005072, partial [Penicillium cf. viridicatum]
HPTSPSPIDRPAKRQYRVSQAPEDEPKLENHPEQASNGTTIEPKIPVRIRGTLTAEFIKVVNLNNSLVTLVLKLLDLNTTSSNRPRKYDSRRSSDSFKRQMSSYSAINKHQYCRTADGRFRLFVMTSTFTLSSINPLAYRHRLPLATDPDNPRQILNKVDPAGHKAQGSSLIEYLFYPDIDSLSGFKWTGPDPLSTSTQASDIFLHISALLFPKDVHWIEFRFIQFDRTSSDTIGEDLIFLPRVETALGNLCGVRRQLLDTITWHTIRATGTSFRLSLWPRTESLPYSSLSTHTQLATLPPTLSLDPRIFVYNRSGNYRWD